MTDPPESPADPRDEPYWQDTHCDCGEELVLYDKVPDVVLEGKKSLSEVGLRDPDWNIFYDEWWCPSCRDGIRMDWPPEFFDELERRAQEMDEENTVPLEEVREAFLNDPDDDE